MNDLKKYFVAPSEKKLVIKTILNKSVDSHLRGNDDDAKGVIPVQTGIHLLLICNFEVQSRVKSRLDPKD